MSDLIERQAAIDALDKRFDDVPMELTTEILQLRRDLRERIPSAQPATNCSEIPNGSDDTISRQAAIDALAKFVPHAICDESTESYTNGLKDAYNLILQLPAAPSTDGWIPVERELPDDLAEVNVTYVNHDPEPYYASTKDKPFTASAVYYEGNWYWYSSTCIDYLNEYGKNDFDKVDDTIEITAWKPLPEPYKRKDSEVK